MFRRESTSPPVSSKSPRPLTRSETPLERSEDSHCMKIRNCRQLCRYYTMLTRYNQLNIRPSGQNDVLYQACDASVPLNRRHPHVDTQIQCFYKISRHSKTITWKPMLLLSHIFRTTNTFIKGFMGTHPMYLDARVPPSIRSNAYGYFITRQDRRGSVVILN